MTKLAPKTAEIASKQSGLTSTGSFAGALAKISAAGFASLLLAASPTPVQANDFGGLIGGVVGGMIGSMQQRPQYYQPPPQPQYYQPAPQYYQAQPQYHQSQGQSSAAARKAAEAKRLKDQADKEKKEQEAAAAATPAPATVGPGGVLDVPMTRKAGGNLWVPAQINKVVTIDFVIDSGASDITLPRDVYMTLIRSGTLTKANYIGNVNFSIADGSEVKGVKFKLSSLQVGNQVLTDVVASVMPSDSATPLLGLSFLSRFQSWAIDNNSGTLKLTPMGAAPGTAPAAATQTAAAAPANKQALPDLPAGPAETATAQAPVAAITAAPPAPAAAAPAAPQTAAMVPVQAPPNAVPASAQSPFTPTTQAAAALVSQPQAEVAPMTTVMTAVPQMPPSSVPMPASEPTKVASSTPDAPRSGRVTSSMFLAKEASAPAPVAAPAAPPPTQMASAAAQMPAFPASTPYANARIGLIALGYTPAAMSEAGKCDANTDLTCFPERLACAKTDSIQCDFMWRRGEQIIKVKTTAIPPTISTVECQVNCNK